MYVSKHSVFNVVFKCTYGMHMPESPTRRGMTVDRPRCPLSRRSGVSS